MSLFEKRALIDLKMFRRRNLLEYAALKETLVKEVHQNQNLDLSGSHERSPPK